MMKMRNEMNENMLEIVAGGICPPETFETVGQKIAEEEERRRLNVKVGEYGGAGGAF